jgi:hypothetical protein
MPVVQIIIDDSTSKVITGSYTFDSDNGGILVIPSGSSFPGATTAKQIFWRTDESKLYRRNDSDTAWVAVEAAAAAHDLGGSAHNADTLANLNTKITDATLDDASDPRDPNAHGPSHHSGGADAIKLDDLSTPDDNTDLNATTSAHGLLPKLGGGTTDYLRADGTWAEPPGGSGGGGYPTGYMYGFRTYNNATHPTYQIDIEEGVCRDEDDTIDMVLTSTLTVDITQSGANGLDTGSEGAWYWYYIYVIYNPTTTTYASLLSLSATSPTLPSGYTKYRRIGSVINNGSSNFYNFDYKSDLGRQRYCSYDEEDEDNIEMLTNGAATSWTDIYLGARIPPVGLFVYLMCRYTAQNYDQSAAMRNKDSSQGDPPFIIYGGANSNAATSAAVFRIWASTTRYIQYINFSSNCALTVWVKGFWDFC